MVVSPFEIEKAGLDSLLFFNDNDGICINY